MKEVFLSISRASNFTLLREKLNITRSLMKLFSHVAEKMLKEISSFAEVFPTKTEEKNQQSFAHICGENEFFVRKINKHSNVQKNLWTTTVTSVKALS